MRKLYNGLLLAGLLSTAARAQYCSPTFSSGCFTWSNQEVAIGALHWSLGTGDCSVSDYTAQSATVNSGTSVPMTVINGHWCGCSVWIDLDDDGTFSDAENLYHNYVGGDPSYTYSFNISIPGSIPTGSYRMRVVAGWGSDGFTQSANGYGPCGSYQYGNFDDFSINVVGTETGIDDLAADASIAATPNPTSGNVMLTMAAAAGWERIVVRDLSGRIVRQQPVAARVEKLELDLEALPAGMYTVQGFSRTCTRTLRIVKQ